MNRIDDFPSEQELQRMSKEELLSVIYDLKSENSRLSVDLEKVRTSEKEGKLRFREKCAESILNSLPDMLTVLTPEGTVVELVSSEATNHVGKPASELIGQDITRFLPEEAYRKIRKNMDRVIATRKESVAQHTLCVDGENRFYENRIFPLDDRFLLCMCRDVTEAMQAKQAQEVAVRKMRMAEDIAGLSYWYFFRERRELEAPGIVPLLPGMDGKQTKCPLETYLQYVHPDDREKVIERLSHRDLEGGYTEHRLLLPGKTLYLHTRVIRSYDTDGVHTIEGYVQDMTYVMERMRELEDVRYAVNTAQEEIFACRPDGSLDFANRQFTELYGLTAPLGRKRLYELLPEVVNEELWREQLARIRQRGGAAKYTVRNRLPDGKYHVFDVATYLIRDSRGEEKIWFFARDISLRVEHEDKIRQLNYIMDAILNNIPVYLFVKDPSDEFRYLYWNKAFEEHSHIPASSVLGRTDFEVFPSREDAEKFRRDDQELLRNGERIEFMEEYITATGERRIVKTSKALIPSEGRLPLIIGVSWDITDLKNTEQELIAARVKAEQSDRLKSAFLANMSHEIRTPLNAIVGFSNLLVDAADPEERKEYIGIVQENNELLLKLISDILDLSKIEAGTFDFVNGEVDLNQLCSEILSSLRVKVKDDRVKLLFGEHLPRCRVFCDKSRLTQVISNFINNALKFTVKGSITLGYCQVGPDELKIYVRDTGSGIPKEKQPLVFDRFVKLNSFVQGTGLGLSICRSIVEQMGGRIGLESKEGEGSCFWFTLPWRQGEASPDEGGAPEQESVPGVLPETGERPLVLVAEDTDSNYLLISLILKKEFRVIRAHNGVEAVELCGKIRPALILMDVKMPEMDGIEATRRIRQSDDSVPIIAVTAFAFDRDRQRALEAGCDDYMAKPVQAVQLKEKIRALLAR